jgi:hypothetical protein
VLRTEVADSAVHPAGSDKLGILVPLMPFLRDVVFSHRGKDFYGNGIFMGKGMMINVAGNAPAVSRRDKIGHIADCKVYLA